MTFEIRIIDTNGQSRYESTIESRERAIQSAERILWHGMLAQGVCAPLAPKSVQLYGHNGKLLQTYEFPA